MMRRISLIFLLVFLVIPSVIAEENTIATQTEKNYFELRDVEYHIDGRTREKVLNNYLDFQTGERFESRVALEKYIAEKLQLIRNQRTLADGNIRTHYEPDPEDPNLIHIDLEVSVSDTWNFILLPYGKYDSNEGLLISLRGRNYNFLGGMEELAVNFDYLKPSVEGNEYSVNSELSIPFFLFDYNWMFRLKEDVKIQPDKPVYFSTELGLDLDVPFNSLTIKTSIDQSYYLNKDGENDPDGWYMTTKGRVGSLFPLGFEVPGFNELDYTPSLVTYFFYKPFDTISHDRRRIELGAEHELSTGQINWLKNIRDGNKLSIVQDLRWNFKKDRWNSDLNATLEVHKSFGFAGLSSRLLGLYRYGGVKEDAGDVLRGIYDQRIDAKSGMFINVDFPIKTWIWFLDRWFEGHISPFFDYGIVNEPNQGFRWSDSWYGGGLEVFAFSKYARSLYLRGSLGVDLEAMFQGASIGDPAPRDGEPIYEVYIGLGHHY